MIPDFAALHPGYLLHPGTLLHARQVSVVHATTAESPQSLILGDVADTSRLITQWRPSPCFVSDAKQRDHRLRAL
jgi:hypothetical protein